MSASAELMDRLVLMASHGERQPEVLELEPAEYDALEVELREKELRSREPYRPRHRGDVISIWGPFGYVRLKRGSDCPEPEAA